MKSLTDQFVTYLENEEFCRRLDNYSRVLKTDEWKFVKDVLMSIKGEMALDMFSAKHTDLSEKDKDVRQRAYYEINLMLDFLSDPKGWVKRKVSIKNKYLDLQSKVKTKLNKGGKEQ